MVLIRGKEEYPFYFGAKPELLGLAADLRKNMTPAEKVLWECLRKHKLKGYRFRNNEVINNTQGVLRRIANELDYD